MEDRVFQSEDVQRIVKGWKGEVKLKRRGNKVTSIELSKTYTLKVGEKEKTIVIDRLVNGYNYLTINGQANEIRIKAIVSPISLSDFENYCCRLKEIESKYVTQ